MGNQSAPTMGTVSRIECAIRNPLMNEFLIMIVSYALGSTSIENLVMRIVFILYKNNPLFSRNIFVDLERRWGSDHKIPVIFLEIC